jgi:hypothetical protein
MARFGFIGPTYQSQSSNVAAQLTMNWYVESVEVQENEPLVLYPSPGLKQHTSSSGKTRGSVEINDRAFMVGGGNFDEIPAVAGPTTNRGNVNNDGNPVSMAAYGNEVMIASAGVLYHFDLTTNALTVVAAMVGVNVAVVDFCDGYFIALIANTNTFRISGIFDGTTWDPLDEAVISVFSGNLIGMKVDHREIWVWGKLAATVYFNTGDADFPFGVNPSASVIEGGLAAKDTTVKLDNTLFWLGRDTRGRGMAWRAAGYTPARVSNHAFEFAISQYADIQNAVGYGYQDQGHSFYVLFFPTALVLPHKTTSATWVYDVATGMWAQRGFWIQILAEYEAHHSWNHVFAFNKHLVGDWQSGILYEMSIDFVDDDGVLIRRARRAPHISEEQKWAFHSQMQVYLESGLGPVPPLLDGAGNARAPIVNLRWSDDGAHTWSDDLAEGAGQSGEYDTRVMWRRLGRSRDRVYEVNCSDPIPWRLVDAYLDVIGGIS